MNTVEFEHDKAHFQRNKLYDTNWIETAQNHHYDEHLACIKQ
jgi:hypothetical protein